MFWITLVHYFSVIQIDGHIFPTVCANWYFAGCETFYTANVPLVFFIIIDKPIETSTKVIHYLTDWTYIVRMLKIPLCDILASWPIKRSYFNFFFVAARQAIELAFLLFKNVNLISGAIGTFFCFIRITFARTIAVASRVLVYPTFTCELMIFTLSLAFGKNRIVPTISVHRGAMIARH
jgi:hypothetical protein